MSRRRAISILESCRLCGLGGIESRRRHFLFGVDANEELLTILRSVLPIVIYPEDPLSKWICTKCREKVTRFYGISREYTKYFGKCLGALRKVDPEQTYLQICSDVETFAATLEDSLLEKVPTATFDRKRLILKDRGVRGPQKKEPPPGEVPTLFEICIDYINNEGPKLLSTYLHVDTSGEWNESEVESSDSSMSYFEDDQQPVEESEYFDASTVECSVNITEEYTQEKNEYQSTPVAVAQNGIGKKRKLSRVSTDMEPIERPTRTKSRVNYSEDIIDEAFFYEQIMLEEYKRKAKSPKKEEPQQPVYKQRQVAAKGTHPRNSIASFPLNDIREQLKTDPTQVIQVNSELSIHLKAKEPRGTPWMPKREIKLEPKRKLIPTEAPREVIMGAWDPNGQIPVDCKFCHKKFQNLAVLSKHQLRHLVLQLKKLDTPEILQPKFRRYSYRFPNFRCCNCLSYYMTKEALKSHWGKGECEYFCRICRAPFHKSRPELHKHYYMAHGVRFNETIFGVSGMEVDESKLCTICYCTFPNFQSRNSHMKIHKKKGEFIVPATTSTSTPPSFQAQHPAGARPRLQINQALQMEIKRMEFASHQRFNGMASSSQMAPRPPMTHILPPPRFPAPVPMRRASEVPMGDGDFPTTRIYCCIPCGEKFPNKKELYQHKRTCQQLLRTCCHLCWKQFTTTSEFENHMRLHHQ